MYCSTNCLAAPTRRQLFAKDGLLDELKKALVEWALNTEMDQHLAGGDADDGPGLPGCVGEGRHLQSLTWAEVPRWLFDGR